MKLVVDTSVILKWFVHAEDEHEEALWYSFVAEDLIVPDLVYAETASALSRKVERGEVEDAQARAVLEESYRVTSPNPFPVASLLTQRMNFLKH